LKQFVQRWLYPPPSAGTLRPEPDFVTIDLELRRKGVTLELLHQEYLALHPEGYRRSAFCAHYETWKMTRGLTMRQVHQGGDRLFVDYSGLKAYYTDPTTYDSVACELFVATLGPPATPTPRPAARSKCPTSSPPTSAP
jgi:transposase